MLKRIEIPKYGTYVCGRKPSRYVTAVQSFAESLTSAPPTTVNSIRQAAKSLKPIYAAVEDIDGNSDYGDCTAAAAIKIQAIFDCATGRDWRLPKPKDALWLYSQTTNPPFDLATGANDNGADLQTVLQHWQAKGLYPDGHGKIKEYSTVNGANKGEVMAALEANGVIYAGCCLPKAWENVSATGFTWPLSGAPDPNAGHCTFFYGFNQTGVFDGSWGMEGTVPWDAVAYYFGGEMGELYTVVPA